MTFNSVQYAVFLAIVVIVYWQLPRPYRKYLLLGGSYLFYAAWDWRFLSLILISTITDFWVGKYLGKTEEPVFRKRALLLSIGVNIGLLGRS